MRRRLAAYLRRIVYHALSPGGLGEAVRRSKRSRREFEIVRDSGLFDPEWYLRAYPDVAGAGLDPLEHFMSVGSQEGRSPGPMFTTSKYLRANPDVATTGMNPLLHFIEFGIGEGREGFGDRHATVATQLTSFAGLGEPSACLSVARTPATPVPWVAARNLDPADPRLVAAEGVALGYAEDHMEREAMSRAIVRLKVLSGDRNLPPGDEPQCDQRLIDAWYADMQRLRTRWSAGDGTCVVRIYQCDARQDRRLRLVGEGIVASELDHVDARLLNPYFPLLVLFADCDGAIRGVKIVTFPSLCRGGRHYPELLWTAGAKPIDLAEVDGRLTRALLALVGGGADAAISRVALQPEAAAGDAALSQPDLRLWLCSVFGVEVGGGEAVDEASTLTIPANAVPTIAALVRQRGVAAGGEALLVSRLSPSEPVLFIEIPDPETAPAGNSAPNAILLSSGRGLADAELLLPVADPLAIEPDHRPAISWLVDVRGCDRRQLLEAVHSLGLQQAAGGDGLCLVGKVDGDLLAAARERFPGSVTVFAASKEAINGIETPLAGFVAPGVLLPDARTCAAFASMLQRSSVATASCVMISAERTSGMLKVGILDGGTMVEADGGPAPHAGAARAAAELWRSHFPVARPSRHLWAARSDDLRDWQRGTEGRGIHLCSSRITAIAPDRHVESEIIPWPLQAAGSTKLEWLVG